MKFSVQEFQLLRFIEHYTKIWKEDELNCRPFLKLTDQANQNPKCFTIFDTGEKPVGFACHFDGDQIILSNAPNGGVVALAHHLLKQSIIVPGIFAPETEGLKLSNSFCEAGGKQFQIAKRLLHWELLELKPCSPTNGAIRPACMQDFEVLVQMYTAMQLELNTQRPYDPSEMVLAAIECGEMFIWDTPERSVACAGLISSLPQSTNHVAIDRIYACPEIRNLGHGTSFVWHLTRIALERKPTIFLSSDAHETPSSRVYEKIGFEVKTKMVNLRAI